MASAVQNALKRKKELMRELGEIEQFLAMHERFAKTGDVVAVELENSPGSSLFDHALESPNELTSTKRRGRPEEFTSIMEEILRETRKPMQRNELVAAVEARGLPVPSGDKARYLGTILWRNKDRFINMAGEGYALKELVSEDQAAFNESFADDLGLDDDVKENALDDRKERRA